MLLTRHNLTYYADLTADLRAAIREGRIGDFTLDGAIV
jgi:queuine/archaeosine tRNA-ribosyltransferase